MSEEWKGGGRSYTVDCSVHVESCIGLVCVVASCAQVFMSKIFLYSS
jgi:hypothetical protein